MEENNDVKKELAKAGFNDDFFEELAKTELSDKEVKESKKSLAQKAKDARGDVYSLYITESRGKHIMAVTTSRNKFNDYMAALIKSGRTMNVTTRGSSLTLPFFITSLEKNKEKQFSFYQSKELAQEEMTSKNIKNYSLYEIKDDFLPTIIGANEMSVLPQERIGAKEETIEEVELTLAPPSVNENWKDYAAPVVEKVSKRKRAQNLQDQRKENDPQAAPARSKKSKKEEKDSLPALFVFDLPKKEESKEITVEAKTKEKNKAVSKKKEKAEPKEKNKKKEPKAPSKKTKA